MREDVLRVWDLPVRLNHWVLAALIAFGYVSGEAGWMAWHRLAGYAVLVLLLFRIAWGFVGSSTARFAGFVSGPRTVLAHLRRFFSRSTHEPSLGHNPLGGWNVLIMLGLVLLQASLGLFAVDEFGMEAGPLASHVSFETGRRMAELHEALFNILLVFIALHVAAVILHMVLRHENLVLPMLTGDKSGMAKPAAAIRFVATWRAAVLLAASAIAVTVLVTAF